MAFGLSLDSDMSHNDYAASLRCILQKGYESVCRDLGHHSNTRRKKLMAKRIRRETWYGYIMLQSLKGNKRSSIDHGLIHTGW